MKRFSNYALILFTNPFANTFELVF